MRKYWQEDLGNPIIGCTFFVSRDNIQSKIHLSFKLQQKTVFQIQFQVCQPFKAKQIPVNTGQMGGIKKIEQY